MSDILYAIVIGAVVVLLGFAGAKAIIEMCVSFGWRKPTTPKPETPLRPYGKRGGSLTQMGSTWLDLSEIIVAEFDPGDPSILFRSASESWGLCEEDAKCLRMFLESGGPEVK